MSIYSDMIAAGVETDHRHSDLYVKDCPAARDVLKKHGKRVDGWSVQPFTSQIDGRRWLDLPFQYRPYWEKRTNP